MDVAPRTAFPQSFDHIHEIYSTTDDHHPMDDPSSPEARASRDENNRLVDTIVKLTPVRGDSLDIGSGGAMFSHQLHRNARLRVGVLEIEDELRQVFN